MPLHGMSAMKMIATKYKREYHIALAEFNELMQRETRQNYAGQDFVLVQNVTNQLLKKSRTNHSFRTDLERLRITAHLSRRVDPPIVPPDILRNEYFIVFCILVDIGFPYLLQYFVDHRLEDRRLPIEREVLWHCLEKLRESTRDLDRCAKSWEKQQYRWCPVRFKVGMSGYYSQIILPFARRESITLRRRGQFPMESTAKLWEVDVLEQLIEQDLREKLQNPLDRQAVRGTAPDLVVLPMIPLSIHF